MTPAEFQSAMKEINNNAESALNQCKEYRDQLATLRKSYDQLEAELRGLRKAALNGTARGAVRRELHPGQFVSDECARHIAAIVILGAERLGKMSHVAESERQRIVTQSAQFIGMEQKAALTKTDIPLPVEFGNEVVELVWKYGQARQYCTVYPAGKGTTRLPKLKTSQAFGFIDISAPVPEKSPQIEFVSFEPLKAGGLVRIPAELDEDSIVPLGQFLARYIAREMARWEDTVAFRADGSGTYKTLKGVGKAAVDLGFKLTLGSGLMSPADITLDHLRQLRSKVATGALNMSAYYLNATFEQKLVSFNNSTNGQVYVPNGATGARLDGFPVRWVDVLPVYDTDDHASQIQMVFGDLSYEYLAVRNALRVETSSDVYFATDELAVRGLERFTIGLMANDAIAALQLAAS